MPRFLQILTAHIYAHFWALNHFCTVTIETHNGITTGISATTGCMFDDLKVHKTFYGQSLWR